MRSFCLATSCRPKSEVLPLRRWPCWPGPYWRLFTGDFGRPQRFWPKRRSDLYLAWIRFVMGDCAPSSVDGARRPHNEIATALAVRPSPSMVPGPAGLRKARAFDGTGVGSQIDPMSYLEKSLGSGERVIARAHFHWWYSVKAWAALIFLFWCLIGIWIFVAMMV